MDTNKWYDDFLEKLYKKFPKKLLLTKSLIDLLEIEREAVYRRLRKDVLFSANEIMTIASAWNISLDDITSVSNEQFSFQMRPMNYIDPSKDEVNFLKFVIKSISLLKNKPSTEFMDICNKLPRQFLAGFPRLNQFYLFKWLYEYSIGNEPIPFSKVLISEEKLKVTHEYYKAIKLVPISSFIFDIKIFELMVNDIKYFHSIYLITDEDLALIKKDLVALLDYLFEIANKGCYPETQNKVELYISQLNIETNYNYTMTPEINICYVHVFEKFEIYSLNPAMVNNFISWMQLKKKTSTQISEVDEKGRIDFFMKQREIVDTL